ncbi:MAG: D-2-hydroxyacid dehydrogenase [Desulfuromonadales bacterium]|nr:D-2-hydroxyacid dehydrogenase [Desulfuromonadales bacterium]
MAKTVFLNSDRLDFDNRLDFAALAELVPFTKYAASSSEEILSRVQGQTIVITKELPVGKELIEDFPSSVKLICEAGTGYNNIDIDAARVRGISVCNVPSYSTDAVAQLAITFMLNLSASLVQQQIMLRQNNFDNFYKSLQVPHFELSGKILGVIGFGEIARKVICIARTLGMKIIVHSRTPKPGLEPDVAFVSLEELLMRSDFLSIHCPLTAATHHLLNRERLALMKPTAFIINTSRGPIIREIDLIEALQRGVIAGAGLDVQEQEPPEPDNPLFTMDNVILTPHIGWKRLETRQRLITLTAANIDAFLQGSPLNVVN